ncbi:MAG: helix-turn-helix transcriptional regulator [Methyloceanibacter sp.]|uniref:helix-turn-helix transcriptional regulator n=1 Tax=Methyloceanibacter sp. TaxID=1965321 RepID=UPI003D6CBC4F
MRGQDEAVQVSSLIGDIYDAALDPGLWVPVLEKICAYVPGSMGNMFFQDVTNAAGGYFAWGHDPYYYDLYLQKYAAINPIFPAVMAFPICEPFTSSDFVPFAQMHETDYYKGWLEPQGYIDFIGCNLEKSATSIVPLAVVRHRRDGFADDAARHRVGLIAPHMRRSVLIGKVIDLNHVQTNAFAETIDGFAAAVFLVDARGLLVHANSAARAMIDAGDPLVLAQDVLVVCDPAVDRALRDVYRAAKAGDDAVATGGMALPIRGRAGERYMANVLPLTSGMRREAGLNTAAVAALFVRKASVDLPAAVKASAQLYGFTPAEERVLHALIEVGGVDAVADALGASRSTIKRHLEHLFAKTGTRRQADLVRLIAGFDSPAREPQQK